MGSLKWKREHCIKLIEAYKKYPVLYNKTHPNYTKPNDREFALMCIVDELQEVRPGTLLPEVKKRLSNLRTQYVRERNKLREAEEHGQICEAKLWCFKDMQFVDDVTMVDDPLATRGILKTSTFDPDLSDDSLSEMSFSSCPENRNESTNMTAFSPKELSSDNIIPDDTSANEVIPEEMNYDEEDSPDELMDSQQNSMEKPLNKAKTVKRRAHISPTKKSSRSKKSKNSFELKSHDVKSIENKLIQLENMTSEAQKLLGNGTDLVEAQNRAFVENLLYDLDELSAEGLQRVKWLITKEVYNAFHNSKKIN